MELTTGRERDGDDDDDNKIDDDVHFEINREPRFIILKIMMIMKR